MSCFFRCMCLKKLRKQIAIENANAAPRGRNPEQVHQATQADRNGRGARHEPLRRSNSRGHASRRPRTHTQRHPVGRTLSPSTAEGNKLGCETQVRRLRTAGRCGLLTDYSCGSDDKIIFPLFHSDSRPGIKPAVAVPQPRNRR